MTIPAIVDAAHAAARHATDTRYACPLTAPWVPGAATEAEPIHQALLDDWPDLYRHTTPDTATSMEDAR